MPLSNPGTSFDEDGWSDVVEDIRRLWLMAEGGSNDLNKNSEGVIQDPKGAFLQILNNLSDVADVDTARDNLGITDGLLPENNLSDVQSASTSRTNLGLGTIATQNSNNVSITGGSIAAITDLAVSDGGTGASTAAAAAYNLVSMLSAGAGAATSYLAPTTGTTHTFGGSSKMFLALLSGAGGGGSGGSSGTGSGERSGNGGGSGGFSMFFGKIYTPTSVVAVGAGGTGGTSPLGSGSSGGGASLVQSVTLSVNGGSGASSTSPGAGGNVSATDQRAYFFSLNLPGRHGHGGRVQAITFNGSGAVSSYVSTNGSGAKGMGDSGAGSGGAGGLATVSGTTGSDGSVVIYEY